MPTMYKLVSQNMTSHGEMTWEIGKTNRATKPGNTMCSNQVLHCYASPLEAVVFNPIHSNIENPILLEICCSEIVTTDGLKYATKEQTPVKVIELPYLSTAQKVAFSIKCALAIYKNVDFVKWAEDWLSGCNRSSIAAADAAARAAAAAAYAAAADAADAAYAAARAAAAAAYAAAADAAAAAYAAAAATYAADAAAYAAATGKISFREILEWVVTNIKE